MIYLQYIFFTSCHIYHVFVEDKGGGKIVEIPELWNKVTTPSNNSRTLHLT